MSAVYPVPMTRDEANAFVLSFHRHARPVTGCRFCIGASDGNELVGVVIVGRPKARELHDGFTAEITRCCTRDIAPKGTPSFLYAAAWRAWRAMGGTRLVTYTQMDESGASLRGAGFKVIAELEARPPHRNWTNRPGRRWQPAAGQLKLRWEVEA